MTKETRNTQPQLRKPQATHAGWSRGQCDRARQVVKTLCQPAPTSRSTLTEARSRYGLLQPQPQILNLKASTQLVPTTPALPG